MKASEFVGSGVFDISHTISLNLTVITNNFNYYQCPPELNSPLLPGDKFSSKCLRCGLLKYDRFSLLEVPMKQLFIGSLVIFFATTASAHGCPGEMRIIDAKMPTAKLPAAEMSKVKALREEGEKLHKEGKHTESMKALADAKKLLGV
jgi:hypothetical protein